MYRSLQRTTTPAWPVTLDEAKAFCRVDGTDNDAIIQDLLYAACEQAEHDTDRAICTATYLLKLPSWVMVMQDLGRPPLQTLPAWPLYIASWPLAPYLELPRPPLVSVASCVYYDPNDAQQTFDPAKYRVDTAPRRGRICLEPNIIWPIVSRRWDAVQITYTAGYGAPAAVPTGLKVAIKQLVSYWFHNPGTPDVPEGIQRAFQRHAILERGY